MSCPGWYLAKFSLCDQSGKVGLTVKQFCNTLNCNMIEVCLLPIDHAIFITMIREFCISCTSIFSFISFGLMMMDFKNWHSQLSLLQYSHIDVNFLAEIPFNGGILPNSDQKEECLWSDKKCHASCSDALRVVHFYLCERNSFHGL